MIKNTVDTFINMAAFIKILPLFFLSLTLHQSTSAQIDGVVKIDSINMGPFSDAANHWYGIVDKSNIINPVANQARYKTAELAAIGDNILLYQRENGGWPKNYDILAILTQPQKDSLVNVRNVLNTTFDNGTSYTHVAALSQIYTATGVEKYKAAALKGIDFVLSAQYANGGWPQHYPLEKNYSRHITFNDGAMEGIMSVLRDITGGKPIYAFIDESYRRRVKTSYEKGLDCIVKTQIRDAGKLTAWCQQHDEVTLQPTWARKFEPPAISNGESSAIVLFLMEVKNPSPEIINAVNSAVAWFEESKILNTRVKVVQAPVENSAYRASKTDRVVVEDRQAPPIWTRFYELETHRPLFCNRDGKVVYSLAEVDRERRDGYAWYTYGPQKVLNKYEAWKKKVAKQ